MDLLSLRYFQAVARREHISRAADDLLVSQPALSRSIARLESEVGVPLFDRLGRRVRLNQFGAMLLGRVDRALQELDDARRELQDAAGLEHGRIAVASETLLTVARLTAEFQAAYPGVGVRLFQATVDQMAERLRAGEVDVCVASQSIDGPDLDETVLRTDQVHLAVPPGHRFAHRRSVKLSDLEGEPIITTRPGHWQRALTDRIFAQARLRPRITCEGDELGATGHLIGVGLGVGLLPAMARTETGGDAVVWLTLDAADCVRVLRLIWRTDTYLSAAAQRFCDQAIAHFGDLEERGKSRK